MQNNRAIGGTYEQYAANYLEKAGYRIVAFNYRVRQAEIDIIAYDQDCLVFIEVKYRKNLMSGHPLEAITQNKILKICRAAIAYMQSHGISVDGTPIRFDVIGILGDEISHIKNAFDYI